MNLIELHDVKGTPATFRVEAIECVYANPEKPESGIVQTTSKLLYQVQESYEKILKLMGGGQPSLVETLNTVHGTKKPRRKKNDEVPQQED